MLLKDVLKNIKIIDTYLFDDKININGISTNDKDINNNMFICVKGEKYDTHNSMQKICDVVDVFVVEEINKSINKCQIKVCNCRVNLLKILINFNCIDINKIKIIGITGTNGKTTTTFYTKFLLQKLGYSVALIGTNGCYVNNKKITSHLTTPNQEELINLLKIILDKGVQFLIMEVSAHAIKQHRVDGINFDVGAFTNISEDHLDDFYSLEEYAYYKFSFLKNVRKRIINIDDKFGKQFASNEDFSISNNMYNANFDYKYINNKYEVKIFNKRYKNESNVKTSYNAYNLTLAIAIIFSLNLDYKKVLNYINDMPFVEGRYKLLNFGNKIVCIDYAHSPDAIEKILSNLRSETLDLIVVFGASGFRDMKKRAQMGKIASKFADYIILTADNPRYESTMQINEQISKYIKKPYVSIENRAEAIEHAYKISKSGSIIAILGKGSEKYQDICAFDFSHNDEEIVTRILNKGNNN